MDQDREEAIANVNRRLRAVKRSRYDRYEDRWEKVSTAAAQMRIRQVTLRLWIKDGHVRVNKAHYPMLVNLADVAYCAALYRIRKETGTQSGAPLINEDGSPYELRHVYASILRKERLEKEEGNSD